MAKFQVTVTPEASDQIEYAFVNGPIRDAMVVRLGDRCSVFGADADLLERIGESFLAAGRDLRMAQVDELEQRALRDEDERRYDDALNWTKGEVA